MAARSPCPVLPDRLKPLCWIIIAVLISHGYCRTPSKSQTSSCRQSFHEITFNRSHVPDSPILGDAGQLCSSGGLTCCTKGMESQLVELSAKEYQTLQHKAIEPLRSLFTSRTNKFDEFFKALLNNSYNDLHTMFVKTYGLLYQQNAVIFSRLFATLHRYYRGYDVDLKEALMSFFVSLLKKMYQLINSQQQLSERYLECVGSQMKSLQPFLDIPKKLSQHVKRSFIVARTFVQGLSIGRDVIINVSKIEPTKRCARSLAQMMYCQRCNQVPHKKPCTNYCMKTIEACQPYHKQFNDVWNAYIHALEKITQQLNGPFNIESVIDPINVKISDAIMSFQNKAAAVTEQASAKCGHPSSRVPRHADNMVHEKFVYEWPSKKNLKRPITAAGTSLDRLVRDITDKVKIAYDFWINVPYFVCKESLSSRGAPVSKYQVTLGNLSSVTAMTPNEENCWSANGKDSDWSVMLKDETDLSEDSDPELKQMKTVISYQMTQLRSITMKLEDAYNGEDVESLINDIYGSGDSSGYDDLSGSGSGDHEDDSITYKENNEHQSNTDGYYFASTTPRTKSFRPAPDDRSSARAPHWSVAVLSLVFTSQLLYTHLFF
ncbi:glypican-6-like [Octopus vulgaris]|uniref:Glypican-6-like n=2 Tax=Octopus TaxID=6643 RepID=A0AA36BNA5_OCTVU|nr:glypican-6-like [Octopus vulgaris]